MSTEITKAKECVYRLLKIRERSEKEIYGKLKIKKFSDETIQGVILQFKNLRFIDDRRFAKLWIQSRLAKPFGLARIKLELNSKGITKEIINEELSALEEFFPTDEKISELAKRRLNKYKKTDPIKAKRRIFEYLLRRGFNFEQVQKATKNI